MPRILVLLGAIWMTGACGVETAPPPTSPALGKADETTPLDSERGSAAAGWRRYAATLAAPVPFADQWALVRMRVPDHMPIVVAPVVTVVVMVHYESERTAFDARLYHDYDAHAQRHAIDVPLSHQAQSERTSLGLAALSTQQRALADQAARNIGQPLTDYAFYRLSWTVADPSVVGDTDIAPMWAVGLYDQYALGGQAYILAAALTFREVCDARPEYAACYEDDGTHRVFGCRASAWVEVEVCQGRQICYDTGNGTSFCRYDI